MKITKKLVRVGSSLGFIIDKNYCKKLKIKKNDWIELEIKKVK